MQWKRGGVVKVFCWLWFAVLSIGLNSYMEFISPGLLLYTLAIIYVTELLLSRVGILVQVLLSLVVIHRTFYVGSLLNLRWLGWLASDLAADWENVVQAQNVSYVTSMTLGLAAIIALFWVYSYFLSRQRGAMPLLAVGTIMLTAAHLWFGLGHSFTIVLYVIIGLLIMGTTQMAIKFSFPFTRWLAFLMICVISLSSIAWALPEADLDVSQWWQDTLLPPAIRNPNAQGGTIGYSSLTGSMGGPLELDETPVLQVSSPVPVYLKGEVRHIYTGNSWEGRTTAGVPYRPEPTDQDIMVTVEMLSKTEGETLFVPLYPVEILIGGNNFARAYSPTISFVQEYAFQDNQYLIEKALEAGDSYLVVTRLPQVDAGALRQLSTSQATQEYTNLPQSLPPRVHELAWEVTAEAGNDYDRAVALVNYLRSGRWDYSLQTEITPQEEDFVDYFLFQQDRGYCVHFSTAFVVMARAVGLPARWVQGYSSGTRDGDDYIVQNNNAHAWGEIWFDDYGWVPFEPTPGSSMYVLHPEEEVEPGEEIEPSEPSDPVLPINPNDPRLPDVDPGGGSGGQNQWRLPLHFTIPGIILAAWALFLVLRPQNYRLVRLYEKIQRRLKLFGWQRQNWETPREHVHRVELPHRSQMVSFVQDFEGIVYGGSSSEQKYPAWLLRRYSVLKLAWHRLNQRRNSR